MAWLARFCGGLLAVLILALSPAGAQPAGEAAQKRVALVLGNSAYRFASKLPNAVADAKAVTAALTGLGFDVEAGTDFTKAQLVALLANFSRKAKGADLAVVYFAGHAVQVDNENYIIPIDARLRAKSDLGRETISSASLIGPALAARSRILVLDACRNDPFSEGFLAPGGANEARAGLARPAITAPGTLIAFATNPGEVAYDSAPANDQNSPFTAAFVTALRQRGQEVNQLFTRVRQEVVEATFQKQTPWATSSLLEEIYLAGLPDARASESEVELAMWKSIERSSVRSDFDLFLKRFPKSTFASLASSRLEDLRTRSAGDLKVFSDCKGCPEMVLLPAGSFVMGGHDGDGERTPREVPPHRVQVKAFAIGRFAVTFEEWDACVAASGCSARPSDAGWGRARRPVGDITYEDALGYTAWLSKKTGRRYRLPSEAEWEYAARGGGESPRFWGNDADRACRFANVFDAAAQAGLRAPRKAHGCSDGFRNTAPVGSFEANGFGLFDMIGNVWQWTADCWQENYAAAKGDAAPFEKPGCALRALRGGSFMSEPPVARVSTRWPNDIEEKDITIGFRLAREAE